MAAMRMDPAMRQTVNNMSLIKSTDKGLTWTRTMAANAEQPMWTNKMFSTGFFFKYGQNGGQHPPGRPGQICLCHVQ